MVSRSIEISGTGNDTDTRLIPVTQMLSSTFSLDHQLVRRMTGGMPARKASRFQDASSTLPTLELWSPHHQEFRTSRVPESIHLTHSTPPGFLGSQSVSHTSQPGWKPHPGQEHVTRLPGRRLRLPSGIGATRLRWSDAPRLPPSGGSDKYIRYSDEEISLTRGPRRIFLASEDSCLRSHTPQKPLHSGSR